MRSLLFSRRNSLAVSLNYFLFFSSSPLRGCLGFSAATSSSASSSHHYSPQSAPSSIPITVLSGFLGSGKTTLLQHLLHNNQGLKIALIVNDYASLNIDSQLIAGSNNDNRDKENQPAGLVELQNGCACCSRSDELLASLAELVTLSDLRGEVDAFDHIVVELSGVADPRAIRSKWQEACLYQMPLTERVHLDTLVTLVDCSTFLDFLKSSKAASRQESPDLFFRNKEEREQQQLPVDEEAREDTDDALSVLMGALQGSNSRIQQEDEDNPVAGLLAAQVETADVVLLNKVDLVQVGNGSQDDATLTRIQEIVRAMAPRAQIRRTTYGQLNVQEVLATAQGEGVALAGLVDDHHDSIQGAVQSSMKEEHNHDHAMKEEHSHSHDHDHASGHESHSHDPSCVDPSCTDTSHSHSHEHGCTDADCTDPTHNHDHSSNQLHAGIGSFVYRARRPFHPDRLVQFLRYLDVKWGLPEQENRQESGTLDVSPETRKVMQDILRSKGFSWLADSNRKATYWSHAGKSFELSVFGSWWATLPRDKWPPHVVDTILQDFDNPEHQEEDPNSASQSVGDRRQDIVVIGLGLNSPEKQKQITAALEQCLLNDDEWETYQMNRFDEQMLRATFPSSLWPKPVTY